MFALGSQNQSHERTETHAFRVIEDTFLSKNESSLYCEKQINTLGSAIKCKKMCEFK